MLPHSELETAIARPAGRSALVRVWILTPLAFLIVEAAAVFLRLRMTNSHAGLLADPVAALVGVTIWTYLVHTRFAFRGSVGTDVASLPPFMALSLAVAIAESLAIKISMLECAIITLAAMTAFKFLVLRCLVWPNRYA